MKKLFIGARGSLGLLTDVTLRLFPLPRLRQNLVISVPDAAEGLRGAKIIRDIYRLCSGLVFAGSPCSLVCTLEGLPEEVDFEASLIADRLSAEGLTGITQSAESSTTDAWCNFLAGTGPETTTFRLGIPFRAVGSVLQETVRLADTECFADLANGLVYLRMPAESASRRPVVEATCSNGGYALMIGGPARRFRPEEMYGYEPDSAALTKALRARWDPRGIMVTG
ncbi:MAG: FAD-binding oxidoreductase [Acidobacteria bacterium]|nr:MAG: FAD-binding oxidoreductase [Acidobacteriota bacterium]